jgi:acyl-CoA thioester hydrolase
MPPSSGAADAAPSVERRATARRIGPAAATSVARYPSGVTDGHPPVDPRRFTARYPVRQYELDLLGHVNNAVYLHWAEQVAIDHVEALGYGRAWSLAQGGGWVVREHRVTYHRPVRYGDVVLVTTLPQELAGVRGVRRTEIHRESDGTLMTEAVTEWIWVRLSDGRPMRVPAELIERFRAG